MTAKRTKSDVPRMPDASSEPDRCVAHGCPLRATIFDSITGPRHDGRCRYHDRLPPKSWPAFTEALNTLSLPEALAAFGLPNLEPRASFKREHRTQSGHRVSGPVTFAEWFARFKASPAPCPFTDQVGPFIRAGAVVSAPVPQNFEAREERAAIQREGDPL